MIWRPNDDDYCWNKYFERIRDYYQNNGHLNLPSTGNTASDRRWLTKQWKQYKAGLLSSDYKCKLESLGLKEGLSLKFLQKYQYYVNHPETALRWITRQKVLKKLGKLSNEESSQLTQLIDNWNL